MWITENNKWKLFLAKGRSENFITVDQSGNVIGDDILVSGDEVTDWSAYDIYENLTCFTC